jgi:hypothetical protein
VAMSSATRRDSSKHHRTYPTRRRRVARGGDDTAACSAVALTCLVTAESSTRQLTAGLAPPSHCRSSLPPLVVSYGDKTAAPLAAGSGLVRRLEDSGDVGLGDAVVVRSLAELAFDMCP